MLGWLRPLPLPAGPSFSLELDRPVQALHLHGPQGVRDRHGLGLAGPVDYARPSPPAPTLPAAGPVP